jgi:hypothetical protein
MLAEGFFAADAFSWAALRDGPEMVPPTGMTVLGDVLGEEVTLGSDTFGNAGRMFVGTSGWDGGVACTGGPANVLDPPTAALGVIVGAGEGWRRA